MGLPMFLCDEGGPVIRVLVLTAGFNASARIVNGFAFKYFGNVHNLINVYSSKRMHEPGHLNYACTITGGSIRKNEPVIRNMLEYQT